MYRFAIDISEACFRIRVYTHTKILFQHIKINRIFVSVITGKNIYYERSITKIVDLSLFFLFFRVQALIFS